MRSHVTANSRLQAWVLPAVQSGQSLKRAAQKAAFLEQAKTDKNVFYAGGDGKLASFGATTATLFWDHFS